MVELSGFPEHKVSLCSSELKKLCIIDRLVRTLRELIEKYYDITGHRTNNIKDVMKSIIDTYNNNSHRTLDNKTPNQVFKDNDDQITRKFK